MSSPPGTMTCFAITREAGAGWVEGKGAFDQPGAGEHAAFMNGLAERGVVLFAGPLTAANSIASGPIVGADRLARARLPSTTMKAMPPRNPGHQLGLGRVGFVPYE